MDGGEHEVEAHLRVDEVAGPWQPCFGTRRVGAHWLVKKIET